MTKDKELLDSQVKEQLLEALPTGKVNISFSELKVWSECSWRHKLQHIDKIDLSKPGIALDFGTAIHACHEEFIKTNKVCKNIFVKKLHELWTEHSKIVPETFTTDAFVEYVTEGKKTLEELPSFYSKAFPNWRPVAAEFPLFEQIDNSKHAFKGFIDAIIATPDGAKETFWILDAKTTNNGWNDNKKADPMVKAQLLLYKNFWSKKLNIDPQAIKCAFLLLKREGIASERLELFPINVDNEKVEKSLKVVKNMIASMKRGVALKIRSACEYCEYKNTEWCT